jgi:osmotically-inducible protein OsmY
MRTDNEIQQDIGLELKWEPRLQDDDLAVGVRDGVVTLAGVTRSFTDKMAAETVASRVKGVRAIANEITVNLPQSSEVPDQEVARAATHALFWDSAVPDEHLQVKVDSGWVRLEGRVDWPYQREEAEEAVRRLRGVRGLTNLITVKPRVVPSDVKRKITASFHRGATFDAERVAVEVSGHTVILRGTVRSFAERREAERAARNAPGVTKVDDRLTVDPYALVPA